MGRSLNKQFFLLFIVCLSGAAIAQSTTIDDTEKDYKDRSSHENFRKRRFGVSAWQINQLKQGALVVRLNTNSHLINALKQRGLNDEAERARIEQAAANINIIRAYQNKYKFSKVYFIYRQSTDSLRNGTTTGLFLDSNLTRNPSLTMNEKFYLLAETDYVFNSSIGFVPEDSATLVTERGNPSSSEFPIVVKNKYGHQLKSPFPYSVSKVIFTKNTPVEEVTINGNRVPLTVSASSRLNGTPISTYKVNGKDMELTIPRMFTYEVMKQVVDEFNADLNKFYRDSATIPEDSKEYKAGKPFFY